MKIWLTEIWSSLLVLRTKQIVDSLDGIEGRERHFHHNGTPVAHRPIPKARQLQSFQFLAIFALVGDEARSRVNEVGKVELLSLIVSNCADEINRIEMRALREHLHILGIVLVNLAALEDLQRDAAIGIVSEERTASRFADILHNTANANRSVQLVPQEEMQVGILQILQARHIAAKRMTDKANHLGTFCLTVFTIVEKAQVGKHLLLHLNQNTCDNLLPEDGIGFQSVGHHIVDVLDEDDVAIEVVEILDESAVSAWTEEQLAISSSERRIVHIDGNRVRTGLLLAQAHLIGYLVLSLSLRKNALDKLLKEFTMLAADSEVHLCLSPTACIESGFREMFLDRCLRAIIIAMELQQALRKLTVVQTFLAKHILNDGLVVSFLEERINAFAFVQEASIVERVEESEVMDVGKEDLLEIRSRHIVVGIEELEHILEHAACSAACRHELCNRVPLLLVVVPSVDVGLSFFLCRSDDAFPYSSCALQLEEVETFAETLQLRIYLRLANAFLLDLQNVFFAEHNYLIRTFLPFMMLMPFCRLWSC